MELAAKQKELDLTTLQVKQEQTAREHIERRLEKLKAHVKVLEAKPLPILKDTESSAARKQGGRKRSGATGLSAALDGWQKKKPSENNYQAKEVGSSTTMFLTAYPITTQCILTTHPPPPSQHLI